MAFKQSGNDWVRNGAVLVSVVVSLIALGFSCRSTRLAEEALEQARRQTDIAQHQADLAMADCPSLSLTFGNKSTELNQDPAYPGHTHISLIFIVTAHRAGEAADVKLSLGARNLICRGKVAPPGTFLAGCRVLEKHIERTDLASGVNVSLVGVVADMPYGLLPVLYELRWTYGSPRKIGVSVGEFLFVYQGAWPHVYKVMSPYVGVTPSPDLSDIVTLTPRAPNGDLGLVRWYDRNTESIQAAELSLKNLQRIGYVQETGTMQGQRGIIDSGEYPNVQLRDLPGSDQPLRDRINLGEEVQVCRRVADWVHVRGQGHTGAEVVGWVVARCVTWDENSADLPVKQPFEGWTLLRSSRWSIVDDGHVRHVQPSS